MNNNETFQQGEWDKVVKNLKNLVDIQCSTGNWNYDPYMQGMANGLICALACLTGEEPKYMSAPKKWLKDCHVECQTVGDAEQIQPQKPQKPKKTVLKAPAMVEHIIKHPVKDNEIKSSLSHYLYETEKDAKLGLEHSFHSFPAKIRLKDGTEQELWFVCEEE